MATKTSKKNKSTLTGTSAADTLTVKHDQVTVTGAGGNDTIKITKGNSSNVSGGAGADTITVSLGKSHVIHGNAGNDTITIGKSAGTGIKVYGDAGNDTVKAANSYAVTFYGGDGSDTLTGGKGGDKLYGEAGTDILYGGAGNDYLYGGDAADKLYGQDGADKLYGQNGNDYLYGGNGNDTLSGGAGDDRLYGQAGTDTLTGGAGKDTFVYANGGGSDKITDYAAGSDTLQISSGSISKTALANSSKDLVFTVGTGKVTLSNAAAKTVSLKDSRGSYKVSKTGIALGSNFTGTMDTAKYLGTVTTVNGKSTTKTVTVKGNAKANAIHGGSGANTLYGYAGNDKLYGYAGNDTLNGGDGDDTLYGGAGTDTLTGGAGKDTFVYANGEGSDTIKDYAAGQDTLYISSGSISKTSLANSNKDLVITVGSGKVTLTNAAGKTVSLKDSRGSYTASNTVITLGSNFTGTMDATKYLASVKTIDGRNVTKAVNITGNAQNNIIYAGKAGGTLNGGTGNDKLYGGTGNDKLYGGAGNDTLTGGTGNDTLTGGAGNDVFVYGAGHDTISDYRNYRSGSQQDKLIAEGTKIIGVTYNRYADNAHGINAGDVKLTTENGGSITLKDFWDDSYALITDERGNYALRMFENGTEPCISLGSDIQGRTFSGNEFDAGGMTFATDDDRGINMLEIDAGGATSCISVIRGNNSVWTNINGCSVYDGNNYNYLYAGSRGAGLNGGSGKDYLVGSNVFDQLYGNDGNDRLVGYAGDDELFGGDGDDNLNGGAGNDLLYGGDGNNTLTGGAGNDMFYYEKSEGGFHTITDYTNGVTGGYDTDKLIVVGDTVNRAAYDSGDITLGFKGSDGSVLLKNVSDEEVRISDSRGDWWLSMNGDDPVLKLWLDFHGDCFIISSENPMSFENAETVTIDARVAPDVIQRIEGKENIANVILGCNVYSGTGVNQLIGGSKDDVIYGGQGSDYIVGGKGNDELIGQDGKDWYVFSASDVVGYTKTIRNYNLNDIIKFQDDCTVKFHFGYNTDDCNDVFLTVNDSGTVRVIDGKYKVVWQDHNNENHQTFL